MFMALAENKNARSSVYSCVDVNLEEVRSSVFLCEHWKNKVMITFAAFIRNINIQHSLTEPN